MKKMFNFSKGGALKLGFGAAVGVKAQQFVSSKLAGQSAIVRIGVPTVLGLILLGQKNEIIKGSGAGMVGGAIASALPASITGFAANTPAGNSGVFGPAQPASTL
jgi:hypothetical protein